MGGQGGGDCSERICPYEISWVDRPSATGVVHKYAECADKGLCERETGNCLCFPGYEGKGCGRQSCPSNCSGRGKCTFLKNLGFGTVYNEYYDGSSLALSGLGVGPKTFENDKWDGDRARACVCDSGWTGPSCEERMCPKGNDIMDVIPTFDEFSQSGTTGFGNEMAQAQTITLFDADDNLANFASQTFAIQFTSRMNETYSTQPIMWSTVDATLASYIKSALKALPMKVIDDLDVSVNQAVGTNGAIIEVTFTGNNVQGHQYPLELLVKPCGDGCSPKITGLNNLRSFSTNTLSKVQITTIADNQSYECGRRGKCDRVTGLCFCFEGYTGDRCNVLTALH